MLILIVSTFPPAQLRTVASSYLESLKKQPPDPALGEMVAVGVGTSPEGTRSHAMFRVAPGKLEAALHRFQQEELTFFAPIEGYRYTIEVMPEADETLQVLGVGVPES